MARTVGLRVYNGLSAADGLKFAATVFDRWLRLLYPGDALYAQVHQILEKHNFQLIVFHETLSSTL